LVSSRFVSLGSDLQHDAIVSPRFIFHVQIWGNGQESYDFLDQKLQICTIIGKEELGCSHVDKPLLTYDVYVPDNMGNPSNITMHLFMPFDLSNPTDPGQKHLEMYQGNIYSITGQSDKFLLLDELRSNFTVINASRGHIQLASRLSGTPSGQITKAYSEKSIAAAVIGTLLGQEELALALALFPRDLSVVSPSDHSMTTCAHLRGGVVRCCPIEPDGNRASDSKKSDGVGGTGCVHPALDYAILVISERDVKSEPLPVFTEAVHSLLNRVRRGVMVLFTGFPKPIGEHESTALASQALFKILPRATALHLLRSSDWLPRSSFTSALPSDVQSKDSDSSSDSESNKSNNSIWSAALINEFYGNDLRRGPEAGTEQPGQNIDTNTEPLEFQSSLSFSFRYGMNTLVAKNVCLRNHSELVFLRQAGTAPLLSAALENRLRLSYSGFHTGAPGGWSFSEQEMDPNWQQQQQTQPGGTRNWHWVSGSSALLSPSYSPSIFHAAQVALVLVQAACDPGHYPWIRGVQRIVASGVSRTGDNWAASLFDLVAHFLPYQLQRSSVDQEEKRKNEPAALFFREDLPSAWAETGDNSPGDKSPGEHATEEEWVCFREAVVCGSLELSTPFLASSAQAAIFREFTYQHLGLTGSDPREPPALGAAMHVPVQLPDSGSAGAAVSSTRSPDDSTWSSSCCSSSSNSRSQADPNHRLRVTLLLRPLTRRVLNVPALLAMLEHTGTVDMHWLRRAVVYLETASFRQQVALMQNTDVLLAPHGAGLQNLIFLRPHSAVVEMMTAPWYEPGYQATALTAEILYLVLPLTDIERTRRCAGTYPESCLQHSLLVTRRSLECYGLRLCDAVIDKDALEVLLWQASQSVRLIKRDLRARRLDSDHCCRSDDGDVDVEEANRAYSEACWYRKAYVSPLDAMPPQ
jgi:hypothetical protein